MLNRHILSLNITMALLGVAMTQSATAGIDIVQTNTVHRGSAGTATIADVTVSTSKNLLLVGVAAKAPNDNMTGSWNGTSLGTPLVHENFSGIWVKMFVLLDQTPGTGSLAVTVPNSTGGEAFSVAVMSLSAPNGFTIPEAKGTQGSGSSLSISFNEKAKSPDIVFGVAADNGDSNPTSSDLGNNLFSDYASYPGVSMTADYATIPNGTDFSWNSSGGRFAVGALLVKEIIPEGTLIILK